MAKDWLRERKSHLKGLAKEKEEPFKGKSNGKGLIKETKRGKEGSQRRKMEKER